MLIMWSIFLLSEKEVTTKQGEEGQNECCGIGLESETSVWTHVCIYN